MSANLSHIHSAAFSGTTATGTICGSGNRTGFETATGVFTPKKASLNGTGGAGDAVVGYYMVEFAMKPEGAVSIGQSGFSEARPNNISVKSWLRKA